MSLMDITGGGKKTSAFAGLAAGNTAGSFSRAMGLSGNGGTAFADELNSQFSTKSKSTNALGSEEAQAQAIANHTALGSLKGATRGTVATGNAGGTAAVRAMGSTLANPLTPPTATTETEAHAKAQKAAQGLVSNALILPILKQIRRSSEEQKGIFSAGNGEKTFGPEFDMQLADRIAQSPNMAITKSLTNKLEKRTAMPVNTKAHKKLDVHG